MGESSKHRQLRRAGPGEVNGSLFDRFTLAHLATGLVYAGLGLDWLAVLTGWAIGPRLL